MSGPFEHQIQAPPLDQYEQGYNVYNNRPNAFQGMPGAPVPYEGYAFWYRPEPQETIYQQESSQYGPGLPLPTPAAADQTATVKHRRTRSGCFTCRNRRVKCDETRPICERCRKGSRECEFPQTTSSSKRAKLGEHKPAGESVSENDGRRLSVIKDKGDEEEEEEEDDDDDDETTLERKQEGEDEQRRSSVSTSKSNRPNLARMRTKSLQNTARWTQRRQQSDASTTAHDEALSPSSDTSDLETPQSASELEPTSPAQRWKQFNLNLKPKTQKYLLFQHDHMTHYHYLLKLDPDDFIHTELIDLALQFEPLLYAVVAYAAYHHTLRLPESEADFDLFGKYYGKSVYELRKWLAANTERNDFVILTVLQLALFEEFLGDWTSLAKHHRAACTLLTTNYTPQSLMETPRGRRMFEWYSHFDVISALMAVRDTVLDRTWLAYSAEWCKNQVMSTDTPAISDRMSQFFTQIRLIGRDVASIFAAANTALAMLEAGKQVDFSIDVVLRQVNQLSDQLDVLRREIQAIHHISMTSADENILSSEDDVFPVSIPLFRGALWPLNFVWSDWYGIMEMLKYQTHMAMQKARALLRSEDQGSTSTEQNPEEHLRIPEELGSYSQVQCSIYSAIKRSPTAPDGAILGCHASVGLSVVFLPRLPRYTMWARKQMALFEQSGYVWPPSIRREMSQLWNIPEVEDWWLPNGEGKSILLTQIRETIAERFRDASEQMQRTGQDDGKNDLRQIKGLFEKMQIRRRSSTGTGPDSGSAHLNMAHAAIAVSSPEYSSTGSASGFSPLTSTAGSDHGMPSSIRARQQSWVNISGNIVESPTIASKSGPNTRMSGIWEEPP